MAKGYWITFYRSINDAEALAAYTKAEEIDPKSTAPKQKLVELFLQQKDLTQASRYTAELLKTRDGKIAGFDRRPHDRHRSGR